MAQGLILLRKQNQSMDKKIEKKPWWHFRKIGAYLLGAGALIALYAVVYKDSGTSRLNVQQERLLVDTVQRRVFQEFIPVSGVVQPIKTVFLDAMEGGRVEELYVEDGSFVEKGQAILRLQNTDLQSSYLNQEANLVAQINQIRSTSVMMEQQSLNLREQALDVDYRLTQLGKTVNRNKVLISDNIISQVEFELAQDEFQHLKRRRKMLQLTMEKDSMFQEMQQRQMESSIDLMERNLDFAKQSLDNLLIKAPIGGQLSSLNKEIGELISRGENIAQIDLLTNFKIRARIDEYYISRIFTGQRGTFEFGGQKYELEIKKIYPAVNNGSFEVDLVFTQTPPQAIKRGQTLSIRLALSEESEALLLAKGSFYQSTGGNWVYVINSETGVARKQEIKIGKQSPSYYEILEGLRPGDIVITSGYDNYNDREELILH